MAGTILDKIIADKKEEVELVKSRTPLATLKERIARRKPRDFKGALQGNGLKLIAEVKKASPSKGVLCPDFKPVEIAKAYEQSGAAAISVLTETKHFQGYLDYLTAIREEVKVFPIKTSTGKSCCDSCENCPDECNICLIWYDVETHIFTDKQCRCDDELTEQMTQLAEETGGEVYELEDASQISENIEDILKNIEYNLRPLELGSSLPSDKNVRTVTIPIPVNYIGEYTTLYFYHWS